MLAPLFWRPSTLTSSYYANLKSSALKMLSMGNVEEASPLIDKLLNEFPSAPEPYYFSGLRALLGGDNAQARDALVQALSFDSDNASVRMNLGVAYQRLGDFEQAVEHMSAAISLAPDNLQARINLGSCHVECRAWRPARETFLEAIKVHGKNATCVCGLADVERGVGNWRRAQQLYEQALELVPDHANALKNLSIVLLLLQENDQVVELSRKAVSDDPDNLDAYVSLGKALVAQEKYEEAMDVFAAAFERDSNHVDIIVQIASNFSVIGDFPEASSWFNRALELAPDNGEAIIGMAKVMGDGDMHLQGLKLLEEKEALLSHTSQFWATRAELQWDEGDADDALESLSKAREIAPQQIGLYCRVGHILSSSGRIDEAERSYLQALEQQPNSVAAISGLATIKKNSLADEYVERAHILLDNKQLPDGNKASLHNALSYYYYGQKNHELAAQQMAAANHYQWISKSRQGWRYDPNDYRNTIKNLKQDYTPEAVEHHRAFGNPSTLPVFIVGMPRSGTTLTEQILARHPAVLGVGERNFAGTALSAYQNLYAQKFKMPLEVAIRKCIAEPDSEVLEMVAQEYLRALNDQIEKSGKPDIQYVVDKMPDNYQNVGWLKLLFPNAHIIHARRDMRDVAMSCWQTQFGSIRWACNTEHLVARFECYADLMEHWKAVFPDGYLEADYESLVADQEEGSRRLIQFIGLPWDDICLKFYESDRLVRTASITQVRQPIYKSSVAKWAPYEELIPELIKPLGQLMEKYRG